MNRDFSHFSVDLAMLFLLPKSFASMSFAAEVISLRAVLSSNFVIYLL